MLSVARLSHLGEVFRLGKVFRLGRWIGKTSRGRPWTCLPGHYLIACDWDLTESVHSGIAPKNILVSAPIGAVDISPRREPWENDPTYDRGPLGVTELQLRLRCQGCSPDWG